eukprot:1928081-Rhodomonas_salina.1
MRWGPGASDRASVLSVADCAQAACLPGCPTRPTAACLSSGRYIEAVQLLVRSAVADTGGVCGEPAASSPEQAASGPLRRMERRAGDAGLEQGRVVWTDDTDILEFIRRWPF